jgi:hypothetical protein
MRPLLLLIGAAALGCGDSAPPDAGGDGMACPVGMHECPSGCRPDDPSDNPATGCRLGCGEACPRPMGGMAVCSAGRCDVVCTAPYVRSGTSCVCMAQTCAMRGVMCGMTDNGCGTPLNCGMCATGQTCTDGQCICMPDDGEPNDTDTMALSLGDFPTMPATTMMFTEYALDAEDDVDFFRVRVQDNMTPMNPVMRVTLSNVPAGSDFELGAWFTCDNPPDASGCDRGTPDTTLGPVGCLGASAAGMDEVQILARCDDSGEEKGGTLLIRVQATTWMNACMPYTLEILVD